MTAALLLSLLCGASVALALWAVAAPDDRLLRPGAARHDPPSVPGGPNSAGDKTGGER